VTTPVDTPPGIIVRSLAEILAHPENLRAPTEIVPRLAWTGRVTLLAAREKAGKSTLAAAGCAMLSRGGYFLGEFVDVGCVLWLSADNESLYEQVARLRRFQAEPQNFFVVTEWDRTPSALFRIADRAAVVVIDTLASFAELAVQDAGSSTAWTPLMLAIKRCANDTGAAFVLLHHANKASNTYRDSTAIGAGVDAVLEMSETTEAPELRRIKARGRWPMTDFSVRLDGDSYDLADNAPSLDAQVLGAIVAEPGISRHAIGAQLEGRHEAIIACLKRLAADGRIENRGSPQRGKWYARTPTPPSFVPVVPKGTGQPRSGSCPRSPLGGNGTTNNGQTDPPEDRGQPATLSLEPAA
jgi:hypothetical protein